MLTNERDLPSDSAIPTTFKGSFADVERDLLAALRAAPSSASLLLALAKLHLEGGGNMTAALDYFQRAEVAGELSTELFLGIGTAYNALRRHQDAERYLRMCLELDPRIILATNQLAFALSAQGEHGKSVHLFTSVALETDTPQSHFNRGSALLAAGRASEAVESYERAVRLRGDLPDFHFGLASAYDVAGRPADAVISLRRVLEIDPSNERAIRELGRLKADTGQFGGLSNPSRRRSKRRK